MHSCQSTVITGTESQWPVSQLGIVRYFVLPRTKKKRFSQRHSLSLNSSVCIFMAFYASMTRPHRK